MTTDSETEIATRESLLPFAEFDRLFDDLAQSVFAPFGRWGPTFHLPVEAGLPARYLRTAPLDVSDTGTAFRLTADLPGIPKEKLEIHVRGSRVEIRGESATSTEEEARGLVHRERTYAGFYRAVELPEPVKATDATATVKDGVLELTLPKLTPTPSPDEVQVPVQ